MKILIIGSGGREHAICWRLHQEGHELLALPGSDAIKELARCFDRGVADVAYIAELAIAEMVDLVVVGPEQPLVDGIADKLRLANILVFGPGASGAKLEGSKIYSKEFFARYNIPSAEFYACKNEVEVGQALEKLGPHVVVKADGLAAGKGVVVCNELVEAKAVALAMLEGSFGDAGARIVIEKKLEGREISVMAICDGNRYELLAEARDHKRIFEGDNGPNTGGMGTISPVEMMDAALLEKVKKRIFDPTIDGLKKENIDFRGVLYAGLMVNSNNEPWLLEYNVRFGDPETQPVLMRLQSELAFWLHRAAAGELPKESMEWDPRTAVCVMLASKGYPQSSSKGDPISGLQEAQSDQAVTLFHSGTHREGGELKTNGGRVLGVTALGKDKEDARQTVYRAVAKIHFDGMQYRRDIGARQQLTMGDS